MIPRGCVSSYGQVAEMAGLGRGARKVGRVLRNLPPGSRLPWHRVINSQGRISFPAGSEACQRQRSLLEAEGVEFNSTGRLASGKFFWQPGGGEH